MEYRGKTLMCRIDVLKVLSHNEMYVNDQCFLRINGFKVAHLSGPAQLYLSRLLTDGTGTAENHRKHVSEARPLSQSVKERCVDDCTRQTKQNLKFSGSSQLRSPKTQCAGAQANVH